MNPIDRWMADEVWRWAKTMPREEFTYRLALVFYMAQPPRRKFHRPRREQTLAVSRRGGSSV